MKRYFSGTNSIGSNSLKKPEIGKLNITGIRNKVLPNKFQSLNCTPRKEKTPIKPRLQKPRLAQEKSNKNRNRSEQAKAASSQVSPMKSIDRIDTVVASGKSKGLASYSSSSAFNRALEARINILKSKGHNSQDRSKDPETTHPKKIFYHTRNNSKVNPSPSSSKEKLPTKALSLSRMNCHTSLNETISFTARSKRSRKPRGMRYQL